MFGPRAMRLFLAVGVCALVGGCAASVPQANLQSASMPADSNLAFSSAHASVISADNNVQIVRPVSTEDIIGWSIRGTSDDIIVDRLQHSGCTFHVSACDEIHLHDAGVSPEVIRAMKASAG